VADNMEEEHHTQLSEMPELTKRDFRKNVVHFSLTTLSAEFDQ